MKLPEFMKEPKRSELLRRCNPNRWSGFNLLLGFLLPFLGMMTLLCVCGYAPFTTDKALIYSDEYHQYYPFFLSMRRSILNGNGLLWNWEVGMGMDFLGMYAYYLASPLNWLSLLIPDAFVLQYFTLLMPLKIGFAGLFFAMFLKGVFKKNDFSIAVFGAFYATCAFTLAYQWNIMWLDSFALLPLVMLGMVRLLREKKFILYIVALLFAFMSNYYIGYIVCLFTFLAFFCHEICRWPGFKRFLANFGRIAVCSILAIGMSLVVTLPGLASLLQTQSTVGNQQTPSTSLDGTVEEPKSEFESVMETFGLNIVGLYEKNYWEDYHEEYSKAEAAWNTFSKANEEGNFSIKLLVDYVSASLPLLGTAMGRVVGNLGGGQQLGFMEGLPNIYCGVATLLLAFLFLTAKDVKIQDKICSVLMVLFLIFSFIFRQLDYIWHGFHFTNMIPYRFSFLLCFVLIYMAYRAWTLRSTFSIWQILLATAGTLFILSCSENREDITFLAYNGIFLLLTLAVLLIDRFEHSSIQKEPGSVSLRWLTRHDRIISGAVLCVLCLELALNIASFGNQFPYTTITNYPKGTKDTAAVVEFMNNAEKDSDFYRTEVTHSDTLNEGALIGFNGITTFSSSANRRVTKFMQYLGQASLPEWNRYCYEESSPVSNLFLNLKYMIERDNVPQPNSYFDVAATSGNVTLLKNNAYLPLGFMVDPAMAELDTDSYYGIFYKQNQLFTAATGLMPQVWETMPNDNCAIVSDGPYINTQNPSGYCTYSADANGGTIHFQYTADREGFMCLNLDFSADNVYSIYIKRLIDDSGDEPVYSSFEIVQSDYENLSQMAAVCDVKPGDFVELNVYVGANETGTINVAHGILNEKVFRAGYDILSRATMDITDFTNTRIQGTVNCLSDGLLYTSIPSDGNWKVLVDGKEADITLIGNAMVGVMLTAGNHEVTFVYQNTAFYIGLAVSVFCLAVFITLIVLRKRFDSKHEDAKTEALPTMEALIPEIMDEPAAATDTVEASDTPSAE